MLPKWSIVFVVFLVIGLPLLFSWGWSQQKIPTSNLDNSAKHSIAPTRALHTENAPILPSFHIRWRWQTGTGSAGEIKNLTNNFLPKVRIYAERKRLVSRGGFPVDIQDNRVHAFFTFRLDDPRNMPIFVPTSVDIAPGTTESFQLRGTILAFPADVHVEVNGEDVEFTQSLDPI